MVIEDIGAAVQLLSIFGLFIYGYIEHKRNKKE